MSSTIKSDNSENGSNLRLMLADEILNVEDAGDMFIVAPSETVLHELGRLPIDDDSHDRSVTVLMDDDIATEVKRNFPVASCLAGLPETVSFYAVDETMLPDMTILSTEFELQALVGIGSDYKRLSSDSETESIEAFKSYRSMADGWEPIDWGTPSRGKIYESLEENFGTEAANDFEKLVSTLEDADDIENAEIKADTVAVLVAAKHELSNYKVSRWVDDVGLVSQATFSRRKKAFENRGHIRTSKIKVPVGRSRHRLHLDSEKSLVDLAINSINWKLQ